jgi:DNA-binding NarL/FixJ family response regulator
MKILAIDDDADLLDNISIILEMAGYKVLRAANGIEGLRLAHEQRPDLIICDIMMPGMTGYEVLEDLQANSATLTIPLIFLTSQSDIEDIRRGMLAGADDYLTKPFTEEGLLGAVQKRLEKRQRGELEQRTQFSQQLVQNQERELALISQELEPHLQQKLLHLKYWTESQSHNPETSKAMLFDAVQNSLNEIIGELNRITYHIYPVMLAQLGLVLSLQWYFNNLRAQSRFHIKFETHAMDRRLQLAAELGFYRIVQRTFESLNTYPETIRVLLWRDEKTVHLSLLELPYLDNQRYAHLFQLLEVHAHAIQAILQIRHDETQMALYVTLPDAIFQPPKQQEPSRLVSDREPNVNTKNTATKPRLNLELLLTLREREILDLILADLTHADIAAKLVISPRTVEKHRANIMEKLGLNSHTELILFALRHGLISPD